MRWIRRIIWRLCRSEHAGRLGRLNDRCNTLQRQRDDLRQETWRLSRECNYQRETATFLRARVADLEARVAVFSE